MPELPEVETVRRALAPALEGARIIEAEVRHPRLARRNLSPGDVRDRLAGRRVVRVGRHGKFLLAGLDHDLTWVTHLGMSGRVQLADPDEAEQPHTHVVVTTDRAVQLRMVDPRTFGFVAVYTPEELASTSLPLLGPDALTELPGTPVLAAKMEGRAVAVKSLLLDQRFLAGLGNIYADEVLHRARIRPHRPARDIGYEAVKRMRAAIRPVLEAGLRWGGTSLSDLAYLLPDGRAGEYLGRLRAYGREGLPCHRDGGPIERTVIGGRSAFWCPRCQE